MAGMDRDRPTAAGFGPIVPNSAPNVVSGPAESTGAPARPAGSGPAGGSRRAADAPADRPTIAGHARPQLWSSVRVRLLMPVLLATAAVAVLGTVQVGSALDQAGRAARSSTLATAAGAVGALAHAVVIEQVENNLNLRHETPNTMEEITSRTDGARAAYQEIAPRLRQEVPELDHLADGVDRALDNLPATRAIAAGSPDGTAEVSAFYGQIMTALLALTDAIPPLLDDPSLVELGRAVALSASLDHLASVQFDLIARDLTRGEVPATDQITLAQWAGSERTQVEALNNLRVGVDAYAKAQRAVGSANAASMRQVLLDDRSGTAVRGIGKAGWSAAQSQRMRELWAMEQSLARQLDRDATALGSAARQRAFLFATGLLAVVAAALGGAVVMVVRISRRLRQTRYAALTAARFELPSAIANVIAARDAGSVRAALTDSSGRIDAMLQSGALQRASGDEIGELATAFGAVHRQALRLAADQALLRMEVQAMFVALSRRGQTLVQRQIHLIDEFSRDEADPDALAKLFALDHLAARMRRNEENLLVLSGGEPGRWITRPVPIIDLVRAAAQEIEEYKRVEVREAPDSAIGPAVAGDVIHLLAELMENATSFSPPSTTVRVSAYRAPDGLRVTISDAGIGIPEERLVEANDRLAHPSALTSTLVGTMGLLVVARLAQRHGIAVTLDSVATAGTTATVVLPDRLVLPLTGQERVQSGQWRGAMDTAQVAIVPAPIPAAAVTSLPVSTAGRAVGSAAVPAMVSIPPPRAPLPLESTVSARPPTDPEPASYTATGLPRRPGSDVPPADVGPTPAAPPGTPDPEAIRARLSSLSGGIAAANREAGSSFGSASITEPDHARSSYE